MKRLVRFCSYYSESLKKSLADAGIKYEWTQEKPDPYQPNYLIFHLDIDAPEYELILKAIDDAKLRSAPTRTESLSFTKKELDDAEWLHVRPSCKKLILMMMLQVQETAPGSADGLVMQRDAPIRFTVKNR